MPRETFHSFYRTSSVYPGKHMALSLWWGRTEDRDAYPEPPSDPPAVQFTIDLADNKDGTVETKPPVVDLDRQTVNRLIKSLRKARDQAFGADA